MEWNIEDKEVIFLLDELNREYDLFKEKFSPEWFLQYSISTLAKRVINRYSLEPREGIECAIYSMFAYIDSLDDEEVVYEDGKRLVSSYKVIKPLRKPKYSRGEMTGDETRTTRVYEVLNILNHTPLVLKWDTLIPLNRTTHKDVEWLYEEYENEDIYFKWLIDQRGRMYPQANSINPIGNDFQKSSILNITRGRKLSDRGEFWLKVSIANSFGMDKKSWGIRYIFGNKDIEELRGLRCSPDDEPQMYYKLIDQLENHYKGGSVDALVGLDASWSGLQIMSIITRCKDSALWSNIRGSKRRDAYTELSLGTGISRKDLKKAIMPKFYMSKKSMDRLGEHRESVEEKASSMLEGAYLFMDWVDDAWNKIREKEPLKVGWSVGGSKIETMIYDVFEDRMNYNFKRTTGKWYNWGGWFKIKINKFNKNDKSLGANLIHSVDAWISQQVVLRFHERTGKEIMPVHDKWYVHPNDVDILREVFKEVILDLYDMDLMSVWSKEFGIEPRYVGNLKRSMCLRGSKWYALS